ncbi:MAG: hypothetical protein PVG78_12635 [Desulfobacterales bacterium]|jgi:hypothetical protein
MKRDIETRLRGLKVAYAATSAALMLLAAAMPLIVNRGVPLTESIVIEEDVAEMLAIAALMLLAAASSRLYQHKLKRLSREVRRSDRLREQLEERLADAFGYIGTLNVEIGEIESVLRRVERYPTGKREFQALLNDFALRAMVIAGAPWALVRIIDIHRFRTVKEGVQKRPGVRLPSVEIGNRALVEGRKIDGFCIVGTGADNLSIRTILTFPVDHLRSQERILLSVIAGQIEMLYLIFESSSVSRLQANKPPRNH